MKKIIYVFLAMFILMSACSDDGNTPSQNEKSDMPISMSLQAAFDHGYTVTRVRVIIARDDYVNSLNLTINGTTAYGTFFDLEEGVYQIDVEAYDNESFEDETLIATGSGSGTVVAGETATVDITLEFITFTGDLEIIVEWEEPEIPQRILFIGNSYTYANGGIDTHFENLTLSAHPDWNLEVDAVAVGGYTFESHFNSSTTIETIENGDWDLVILQEQSTRPVNYPELMYEFADSLDGVITGADAETAFFMTWAREYDPEMIEDLAASYNHCGNMLDAIVNPVGRAWQASYSVNPELSLHQADGSHPNVHGTYLACCVFYAMIWGESPVGIEYVNDPSITETERAFLQNVAWEVVQLYTP